MMIPGKNTPAGTQIPYVTISQKVQRKKKETRPPTLAVVYMFIKALIVPPSVLKPSVARGLYVLPWQVNA